MSYQIQMKYSMIEKDLFILRLGKCSSYPMVEWDRHAVLVFLKFELIQWNAWNVLSLRIMKRISML